MSVILRRGQVAVAAALFAVAGAAAYAQGPHGHHGRHGGTGIEQVIAQVKDKLALNSSQQVMWDNAIASTKAARQAGRAERERIHAAMKAELAKAEPDLAAVAALADQAQAAGQSLRHQVRGRVAEALRDVHAGAEAGRPRRAGEADGADRELPREDEGALRRGRVDRGRIASTWKRAALCGPFRMKSSV